MKAMITICPVPAHDNGEISLFIDYKPHRKIKTVEIKDNENAINFRTWFVEINFYEQKNITFKLLKKHNGEKTVFIEQTRDLADIVSIEEFKEKELLRICKARDDNFDMICNDKIELEKCLSENNLSLEDNIYIIEVSM